MQFIFGDINNDDAQVLAGSAVYVEKKNGGFIIMLGESAYIELSSMIEAEQDELAGIAIQTGEYSFKTIEMGDWALCDTTGIFYLNSDPKA